MDFCPGHTIQVEPKIKKIWTSEKKKDIIYIYMGVSRNRGTLKSSILIGFSTINHPFWGTPIFGNSHIYIYIHVFMEEWKMCCKKTGVSKICKLPGCVKISY